MNKKPENLKPLNDAEKWVGRILDAAHRNIQITEQFEYDTAEMHSALIAAGFYTVSSSVDLRNIVKANPERVLVVMGEKPGSRNIVAAWVSPAKYVSHELFSSCIVFASPDPEEDTGTTDEFEECEATAETRIRVDGTLKKD